MTSHSLTGKPIQQMACRSAILLSLEKLSTLFSRQVTRPPDHPLSTPHADFLRYAADLTKVLAGCEMQVVGYGTVEMRMFATCGHQPNPDPVLEFARYPS